VRRYVKKPITVEAVQFGAEEITTDELWKWVTNHGGDIHYSPENKTLEIKTLEGRMLARPGDWIIRGVLGEFYPCKDEIFRATYEIDEGFNYEL
jgi:hypothetical protein